MDRVNGAVFEFGEFHLDTTERVLRRNGDVVSLTPKAVSLLELLVSREGVISRAEMIETLWPDTYVEEANLTVTISMLRKALGENFIRTIPKRGYTFAVPVHRIEPPSTNGIKRAAGALDPATTASSKTFVTRTNKQTRLILGVLLAILVVTMVSWAVRNRVSHQANHTKAAAPMRLTRLTDTGNIRDVTISPDGNWLAVVSIESGLEGLKIKNLETNEQRELFEPQEQLCWGLHFAHDGQSIYYNTTQKSTISVLYRISTRGGQPSKIVVNIDSPVALSPDGSRIAFVRSFPGMHYDALVVANNDGTGEREIAVMKHPEKFSFSGAAWSPDGKTIALGVSPDNGVSFSIHGIPVAGGEMRALTPQQWTTIRGMEWSDDGHDLIFSAGTKDAPAYQLWRLVTESGAVEPVTNDTNLYEGVHLTKNGARLVTTQSGELINLWILDSAAGAAPRKLTFGTKEGEGGVLALPNGQVVYTLEQNRRLDLWAINTDGTGAVQLTHDGASFPAVTADGKYLVYASLRTGVRHLYRLDLATRQEVQLTDGGGENFPSCSPDGRWVIYTALAGARNTLWKVSIDGGTPQQLTQGSIIIKPLVSPDGKSVACMFRKDEADIWKIAILPFTGGEPLQVLDVPKPFNQILRWAPDSRALYYVVERRGVGNIWKQPLDGSAPEQVTQFTEDQIYYYDRNNATNSFVLARGRILRDIVLIRNP